MAGIGKNVIENLTEGMYENAYTVYREYIQNSADSIDKAIKEGVLIEDEGIVDIDINPSKRRVSIHDNAYGINESNFYKILTDIADSTKDASSNKGFRGIGRLAGLAYCEKLIFRSSAKGETSISILEWNGNKLREILGDNTQHPSASELIDSIITYRKEDCDKEEHFFEVIMENIIKESDNLLDEHEVIKYLQAVAPVPYVNTFIFKSKIHDFAKENGFKIDEYYISVNGNQLLKPFKTKLYEGTEFEKKPYDEINDVEFHILTSKAGNQLGWLWFGVTKFEKQIPVINEMRGIRLRKENIQIGDDTTLNRYYKEPRGSLYFIGELFATNDKLLPNARRDNFKLNSTFAEFEETLKPYLFTDLSNLYRQANEFKKATQKVADYQNKVKEFNEKNLNAGFINNEEKEKAQKALEEQKNAAEEAQKKIERKQHDAENDNNSIYQRVFKQIEDTYKPKTDISNEKSSNISNNESDKKFLTQKLSKYNKQEQKLISRIYNIIKLVLPNDMAEMLVTKIQEELQK